MEYIENATLLWKVIHNEFDFIKLDPTRINIYPRPDVIMTITHKKWNIISPQYLISQYNSKCIYVIGPHRLVLTYQQLIEYINDLTSGAITGAVNNETKSVVLDGMTISIEGDGTISYNDGLTTQQIGYDNSGQLFKVETKIDRVKYEFEIIPTDITTDSYQFIIDGDNRKNFMIRCELMYNHGILVEGTIYREIWGYTANMSLITNSDHTVIKVSYKRSSRDMNISFPYDQIIEHLTTTESINDFIDTIYDE